MSDDCSISTIERDLLCCLEDIDEPFTVKDALTHLRDRHEEFIDRHRSARHRPWMHTTLNELVSAGMLSRLERESRVFYSVDCVCL